MIKKYVNCYIVFTLIITAFYANASENIVEEAEQIKSEFNGISEQALQSYLNDEEISGSKKEKGVRLLNRAKIEDSDLQKFLNDPELSESKKAKILKRLQKLTGQLKAKCSKGQDEDKLNADVEFSEDSE